MTQEGCHLSSGSRCTETPVDSCSEAQGRVYSSTEGDSLRHQLAPPPLGVTGGLANALRHLQLHCPSHLPQAGFHGYLYNLLAVQVGPAVSQYVLVCPHFRNEGIEAERGPSEVIQRGGGGAGMRPPESWLAAPLSF